MKSRVIVTVGHVDHGKSSVIGRMLADANVLPKGKLQAVKESCERTAKPFEYAYLLDALKCEQAQGITLDVARCSFEVDGERFEILDAPGHFELLKNMVTGASRADAALLVVDASVGMGDNTRRHAYYLKLLGVEHVIVALNKMDVVGYDSEKYFALKEEVQKYLSTIDVDAVFLPVSAVGGDNIVFGSKAMPWYTGKTLLDLFKSLSINSEADSLPLRFPVQDVYKFDDRRILAGTIASGRLNVGDEVTFYPSGKRTTIASIEALDGKRASALQGEAIGITCSDELILTRGEVVVRSSERSPLVGVRVRANVFWLGKSDLVEGKTYVLKIATARTEARVIKVENAFDAGELKNERRAFVRCNEIATLVLQLESPIVFDLEKDMDNAKFVLVDDYEISGGGKIIEKLRDPSFDEKRLKRAYGNLNAAERMNFSLSKGAVVWLSGVSGSGKTTIAKGASYELAKLGVNSYVLDGDELRAGVNSDLDFSAKGREINVLRAGYIAKILKQAGVIVFVTLISPYQKDRLAVKEIIGRDFYGVYVKASQETCRKRDPKKLYAAAEKGEIGNFTGYSSPYEEPTYADLVIDTETLDEPTAVEKLLQLVKEKILQ